MRFTQESSVETGSSRFQSEFPIQLDSVLNTRVFIRFKQTYEGLFEFCRVDRWRFAAASVVRRGKGIDRSLCELRSPGSDGSEIFGEPRSASHKNRTEVKLTRDDSYVGSPGSDCCHSVRLTKMGSDLQPETRIELRLIGRGSILGVSG